MQFKHKPLSIAGMMLESKCPSRSDLFAIFRGQANIADSRGNGIAKSKRDAIHSVPRSVCERLFLAVVAETRIAPDSHRTWNTREPWFHGLTKKTVINARQHPYLPPPRVSAAVALTDNETFKGTPAGLAHYYLSELYQFLGENVCCL
ncbi:hypothetical protein QR680_004270 [Steinernema hermaphroditum]|uniref:Uncharacterized protein n=1 Tax=Steinernema hermaphroditum TaxID=289476 RepID=A0AA39LTF8_9BILA|nr:hypothetical protein QR680_004270 [Steinernema hermaphroditum]